jgi:hypothetical protein
VIANIALAVWKIVWNIIAKYRTASQTKTKCTTVQDGMNPKNRDAGKYTCNEN